MEREREVSTGDRGGGEGSSPSSASLAELRALQQQTRQILDSANDAFVAIDDRGVIIDWNRAAELIFGWSAEEAVGLPLAETIVPPSYRSRHEEGLSRFLETGEQRVLFQRLELSGLHRDGHEFPVELTIWPTRTTDDRWRFNAFLRDISERRRLEAHADVVHHVAATANAAASAEDAVRDACRAVLELTGWELAHAYLVVGERLEPSGWWEPSVAGFERFRSLTASTTFDVGEGLPGRVAASKRPHWIPDIGSDRNFPRVRAAATSGLVTAHAFPVVITDRVVAVMEFFSAQPQSADEELLALMADVGVHLGRVFERQEADRWRTRMISTVAHEVRTPLVTMGGTAALLEQSWEELPREQRDELLASIVRQGQRLQRLVTDLLTLARLDDRRVTVEPTSIHLAEVVRQAVDDFDVSSVEISVPEDVTVHADPDHVLVIVGNLLSNAAKYGEPPLAVSGESTAEGVAIRISDEGPGIDPDFVPHLFEEFTRSPSAAGQSGSGLGLSIAHRMARANHGSIRYEPNAPNGACFTVELPTG
jgi:two-component system, cell cycle sensor histidine kinase and response regulator CckA